MRPVMVANPLFLPSTGAFVVVGPFVRDGLRIAWQQGTSEY